MLETEIVRRCHWDLEYDYGIFDGWQEIAPLEKGKSTN